MKQEKSCFLMRSVSTLLQSLLCKESKCSVVFWHGSAAPLMEGSPLGPHSSHQWSIDEAEKVLSASAGPRWESLSVY